MLSAGCDSLLVLLQSSLRPLICGRSCALGEKSSTRGSVAGSRVLACRGSDTVLMTVLQACHRLLTPSPTPNREYAWQLLDWRQVVGTTKQGLSTPSQQPRAAVVELQYTRTAQLLIKCWRSGWLSADLTGRQAPSRPEGIRTHLSGALFGCFASCRACRVAAAAGQAVLVHLSHQAETSTASTSSNARLKRVGGGGARMGAGEQVGRGGPGLGFCSLLTLQRDVTAGFSPSGFTPHGLSSSPAPQQLLRLLSSGVVQSQSRTPHTRSHDWVTP